ncbi:MAG: hypothetical protein N2442_14795 [Spirochaetes bacterium]|nr:hypothetical protein [Spirochaetota bacterium]
MKMSPELKRAQENMQPGVITSAGFLGEDTRNLVDIIEQDEETLQKLGIDIDEASGFLHHLLEEGRKGLGEPITVKGIYQVQVTEARGFLACPFEDGIFRKTNAEVTHLPSGTYFLFSELSLHLFEKHHFLQGLGSPFRIDPFILKKLLP